MSYTKCKSCKGEKRIKGLGGMDRKCPTCKGVGYTEQVEVVQASDKPKGKPGRPKKIKV